MKFMQDMTPSCVSPYQSPIKLLGRPQTFFIGKLAYSFPIILSTLPAGIISISQEYSSDFPPINHSQLEMEKSTGNTYEKGDLNLKATELRLGLPGSHEEEPEKQESPSIRSSKRASSEIDNESDSEKSDQNSAPATKAQVVGWPPVRSYRKNVLQQKKTSTEAADVGGMYVKVSMDGAPYLRKIDLKIYKSYPEFLQALEYMFKCKIGVYSEGEGYNACDYAPTYEDKDGDWMLAGDVPWEMFIISCKRMRIMKGSDAKGLGCL